MGRPTWLATAAAFYAFFGIGLLAVPAPFMSIFAIALDDGGQLMARILGSALLTLALTFWLCRSLGGNMLEALLVSSFIYNVIDLVVVALAVLSGTMNSLGLGPVALHVLLAVGFGYYAFLDNRPAVSPKPH